MIRGIGFFIIPALCFVYGAIQAYRCRREVSETEGLAALVRDIGDRIEQFGTPLHEIYADFHNDHLEKIGFLALLRETDFKTALERFLPLVGTQEKKALLSLADKLGKSDSQNQILRCRDCAMHLENRAEQLRKELPSRVRLWLTLPAAGGLMLDLLLL